MILWTIGAGGLLGSALGREAARRGIRAFPAGLVPWDDEDAAIATLSVSARDFAATAGDGPWAIAWAAGAVTTASTQAQADAERSLFERAMGAIAGARPSGDGAVFLASSAGGVYAGSDGQPFDEHSEPQPLSPYGELKLAQERIAAATLRGTPVVIGRMGNLYGPGQNLGKLQGLVSRLALAAVTREPVTMFVPLDTIRDYLDADDAAAIAMHWLERAIQEQRPGPQVRVIASGQPVSLGALIHLAQGITRTRFPIAVGTHGSARAQARDLRLQPTDDGCVGALVGTTLPAGIKRVYLDIVERHAVGFVRSS